MSESLGNPTCGPGDSSCARTTAHTSPADLTSTATPARAAVALSLVLPAYNESQRLPPYLESVRRYLEARGTSTYEVIVVDDGSSDHLLETLQRTCGVWPQLTFIRHPRNLGKGAAVRTGVQAARGERILFADADGATPIEEEHKLSLALEAGADVAIGSRLTADSQVVRCRTARRAAVGRLFATVVRQLFALNVLDTQCGFKMFRRPPATRLFALSQENGYLFDIEILALARQLGYRIAEVSIHWADRPGSRLNLWKDGGQILLGLQRLRRRLKNLNLDYDSNRPA